MLHGPQYEIHLLTDSHPQPVLAFHLASSVQDLMTGRLAYQQPFLLILNKTDCRIKTLTGFYLHSQMIFINLIFVTSTVMFMMTSDISYTGDISTANVFIVLAQLLLGVNQTMAMFAKVFPANTKCWSNVART